MKNIQTIQIRLFCKAILKRCGFIYFLEEKQEKANCSSYWIVFYNLGTEYIYIFMLIEGKIMHFLPNTSLRYIMEHSKFVLFEITCVK